MEEQIRLEPAASRKPCSQTSKILILMAMRTLLSSILRTLTPNNFHPGPAGSCLTDSAAGVKGYRPKRGWQHSVPSLATDRPLDSRESDTGKAQGKGRDTGHRPPREKGCHPPPGTAEPQEYPQGVALGHVRPGEPRLQPRAREAAGRGPPLGLSLQSSGEATASEHFPGRPQAAVTTHEEVLVTTTE